MPATEDHRNTPYNGYHSAPTPAASISAASGSRSR